MDVKGIIQKWYKELAEDAVNFEGLKTIIILIKINIKY